MKDGMQAVGEAQHYCFACQKKTGLTAIPYSEKKTLLSFTVPTALLSFFSFSFFFSKKEIPTSAIIMNRFFCFLITIDYISTENTVLIK